MAKSILPRVHVLVICDDIEERWESDSVHDLLGVRTQLTAPMFRTSARSCVSTRK